MSTENLIKMVNQIAQYFASEPDQQQAVLGVRNHLQMYWTPGMRKELLAWQTTHQGADLHPLAQAAVSGAGWEA
ncbi:formate dehydrogenase subunit delta [Pseudomonas frederiksbergensis]|jgi:formate dehydrogenase subunit delta|uniref:formate dehydrogenase subunit delta n=1 Tax=Pseudomonas TaxID=286 RepID=UPI00037E16D3|nr:MULTISPECIES: formate dehydrogenase subunit delta [Pseudomonas]ANI58552.1 formate dehydrogenase [Pseudomonas sp. GR 6-02]MBD9620973.1 formate dehydrogenase subunit delta [Pseudomonas sp. PDM07]PZW52988.1 formate dehydrogenase subunit delta [Pseudomonas sp. URMO17WK12:I6]QDV93896.1 formate dehydrogenase subunit delta [Pseudomonas sp. ATCC 43928]UVM39765.1 formate dehydrogenase subunit delta [Pseudomonas sp. B21-017]